MKDKEVKAILKTMVILIDTREHLPNHITDTFDTNGISWERKKLLSGDYSAYIPKNDKFGIMEDISLENDMAIERKMGLNEIGTNLTTNRNRFKREFARKQGSIILMIEGDTYQDIVETNYQNKIAPNSFLGSLHGISAEYNIPFIFINKYVSPLFVYKTLYYHLRNKLNKL